MINLSFDELRLIAQLRNISNYENKSKEDLIKALSVSKPEIPKPETKTKPHPPKPETPKPEKNKIKTNKTRTRTRTKNKSKN